MSPLSGLVCLPVRRYRARMSLVKKCRHERRQWDHCGCAWYEDYRVKQDGKTRRVYNRLGSTDRLSAEVEVMERRVARERARLREAGAVTFEGLSPNLDDVVPVWLDDLKARGRRQSTLDAYESRSTRWKEYFGTVPIRDWTTEDIEGFAKKTAESGVSRSWHTNLMDSLKLLLRWIARHHGETPGWPDEHAVVPKTPKRKVTLPEAVRLVDALPVTYRPLGRFIMLTGLRIGEALAVRHADVSVTVLRVWRQRPVRGGHEPRGPKTDAGDRSVNLSPEALEILSRCPSEGWCFPWAYSTVNSVMHACATVLGFPPRTGWHSLRDANAELRERAGEGIRTQQSELGHTREYQTRAYGAAPPSSGDALDAALRDATAG